MNNFKEGGFKKKRGDFGRPSKFGGNAGGRDRRPGGNFGGGDRSDRGGQQEMFTTTCAACHKSCEVPFRPNGEKPVYCRECFGKRNNDDSRGGGGDSRSEYRSRDESPRGKPDYAKPSYQAPQASAPRDTQSQDYGEMKKQLATIEARLNRILDILKPPTQPEKATVVKEIKVTEKVADTVVVPKKEVKAKSSKTASTKVVAPKKVAKTAKKVAGKK
jgi:CxxC-x17-CxxC domain-containing protein